MTSEKERRKLDDEKKKREAEFDEHDAAVESGSAITLASEALAGRMALGAASLTEIQEMATLDISEEPYADRGTFEFQCMLSGIDPSSGTLAVGPTLAFLEAVRNGRTEAEALQQAAVVPTALALWVQHPDFARQRRA